MLGLVALVCPRRRLATARVVTLSSLLLVSVLLVTNCRAEVAGYAEFSYDDIEEYPQPAIEYRGSIVDWASQGRTQDDIEAFNRWMGFDTNHPIVIKPIGGDFHRLGLFAVTNITANTPVACIPTSKILDSVAMYKAPEFSQVSRYIVESFAKRRKRSSKKEDREFDDKGCTAFASTSHVVTAIAFLMLQIRLGSRSPWGPYVKMLPQGSPLLSERILKMFTAGSGIHPPFELIRETRFEELRRNSLRDQLKELDLCKRFPKLYVGDDCSEEAVTAVGYSILSKCFEGPFEPESVPCGLHLQPWLDLGNHSFEPDAGIHLMALDYHNTTEKPTVETYPDHDLKDSCGGKEHVVTTSKNYKPGEEVVNRYYAFTTNDWHMLALQSFFVPEGADKNERNWEPFMPIKVAAREVDLSTFPQWQRRHVKQMVGCISESSQSVVMLRTRLYTIDPFGMMSPEAVCCLRGLLVNGSDACSEGMLVSEEVTTPCGSNTQSGELLATDLRVLSAFRKYKKARLEFGGLDPREDKLDPGTLERFPKDAQYIYGAVKHVRGVLHRMYTRNRRTDEWWRMRACASVQSTSSRCLALYRIFESRWDLAGLFIK